MVENESICQLSRCFQYASKGSGVTSGSKMERGIVQTSGFSNIILRIFASLSFRGSIIVSHVIVKESQVSNLLLLLFISVMGKLGQNFLGHL